MKPFVWKPELGAIALTASESSWTEMTLNVTLQFKTGKSQTSGSYQASRSELSTILSMIIIVVDFLSEEMNQVMLSK